VDTPADLRQVTRLFEDLYTGHPIEIEQVVAWLNEHASMRADVADGAGRDHG
jgi:hypothetical protein